MLTSYHNHSTWSDGTASIREMALAARDAGVTEFGISDHLVLPPTAAVAQECASWSMKPAQFAEYVHEAQEVKAEMETAGFQFRIGVEADYFDETIDTLKMMLAEQPLDYVIGAAHYAADFAIDHSKEFWDALPDAAARHRVWEIYLDKLQRLCAAGFCDFVAHLDLPKKFREWLPDDLRPQMDAVLAAVSKAGLAIEINTAGLDKLCQEWYPADNLLRRAVDLGIPMLVNADAHATTQVIRHFAEARTALRNLGVTHLCEFSARTRQMIPLEPSVSLAGL